MMHSKQLLLIISLSTVTFCFVFAGILLIPSVRQSAIDIFTSYNTDLTEKHSLVAGLVMAIPNRPTLVSISSSTTTDSTSDSSQDVTPPPPPQLPTYTYKLIRSVDECTLNKMGKSGYQAVQFGGSIDTGTGHNSVDCNKDRIVDVLDWVLFVRQD